MRRNPSAATVSSVEIHSHSCTKRAFQRACGMGKKASKMSKNQKAGTSTANNDSGHEDRCTPGIISVVLWAKCQYETYQVGVRSLLLEGLSLSSALVVLARFFQSVLGRSIRPENQPSQYHLLLKRQYWQHFVSSGEIRIIDFTILFHGPPQLISKSESMPCFQLPNLKTE